MIHQAPYGLSRHSLRDQIRETLLKRIGAGELQPGDRIVEARLAEEFGVSSIPIREAIRELVAMRVLEFANHKGAWVRQISLAETVEGLEIKALEAGHARKAAELLVSHAKHLVTYLRDQMAANDGGAPPAIVSKRSKPPHRAVALAKNSDPTRKTITKSK